MADTVYRLSDAEFIAGMDAINKLVMERSNYPTPLWHSGSTYLHLDLVLAIENIDWNRWPHLLDAVLAFYASNLLLDGFADFYGFAVKQGMPMYRLYARFVAAALKYWGEERKSLIVGKLLGRGHLGMGDVLRAATDVRPLLGDAWKKYVAEKRAQHKKAYAPLKEELMAATWHPRRFAAWCLDIEEVAEEFPDGLCAMGSHEELSD